MVCIGSIVCFGRESLALYADMHHNWVNQIIHGVGMPFVGYAVFGGVPLIYNRLRRKLGLRLYCSANQLRVAIYLSYLIYYWSFDLIGAIVTGLTYLPLFVLADFEYNGIPGLRLGGLIEWMMIWFYILVLVVSIGFQEGVGHSLYEETNSILIQLPNSILIAPLFGTRALLHNIFGLSLTV
jgi:uncharacterized membrane protein YGL010W